MVQLLWNLTIRHVFSALTPSRQYFLNIFNLYKDLGVFTLPRVLSSTYLRGLHAVPTPTRQGNNIAGCDFKCLKSQFDCRIDDRVSVAFFCRAPICLVC